MITLYNDDCFKKIKEIPDKSVDFILTDPPYELDNHGGNRSGLAKRCCKVRDEVEFILK